MKKHLIFILSVLTASMVQAQDNGQWIFNSSPISSAIPSLGNERIYTVESNTTIGGESANIPGLMLEKGRLSVIYIRRGVTLKVIGGNGKAGIHLPDGATLVIAGDPGARLEVVGGRPMRGEAGENGRDSYARVTVGRGSYGGDGGRGGRGGTGGGAAIGGNGGTGGIGGVGGRGGQAPKNGNHPGENGGDPAYGEQGTPMGTLYIMGDVVVAGSLGQGYNTVKNTTRSHRGKDDYHSFFQSMGTGGGGAGANGAGGWLPEVTIGEGGYGGAGGGGGGGGATDHEGIKYEAAKCYGGGGHGSQGGDGWSVDGQPDGPNFIQRAEHGGYGGSGLSGMTDQPHAAGHGSVFVKDRSLNLSSGTSVGTQVIRIDPDLSPLKTILHYDYAGQEKQVSGGPRNNAQYYFGMQVPEIITVPLHMDTATFFEGFYYNGTKVYDHNGKWTGNLSELFYTFDKQLTLTARWKSGRTQAKLTLLYQNPDAPTQFRGDTLAEYFVMNLQEAVDYDISPKDSKYLKEGYYLKDTTHFKGTVHAGDQLSATFTYYAKECHMEWHIRPDAPVYINEGSVSYDKTETILWGATTKEPQLGYKIDKEGVNIIGWSNRPRFMNALSITDNWLQVERVRYPVYCAKAEHGNAYLENKSGSMVDSLSYGDTLFVRIVPAAGYDATWRPKVYQYHSATKGDTVACIGGMPVPGSGEYIYQYICKTPLFVQPLFHQTDYHMTVSKNFHNPQPAGVAAPVMATTKEAWQKEQRVWQAEQLAIHMGEYVSVASWLETDTVEDWYSTICAVAKNDTHDTLKVQWSLTDKIPGPNKKKIYMPCYTFEAPMSDVELLVDYYYLPKSTCTFFNRTKNNRIDSVYVNFNSVTLPEDSTTATRALDIVSMLVLKKDTAAIKAGYFLSDSTYQKLNVRVDMQKVRGGRYQPCYSTIAPAAPMIMGLIDGLNIILVKEDSSLNWVAPSAALEGDSVQFILEHKVGHERDVVELDSVVMYDENNQCVYKFIGDDAYNNYFVMPNRNLFVYIYARKTGVYHKVTFLNINGDTLCTQDWLKTGDSISYPLQPPTYVSDTTYLRYEFIGWTPQLHPVVADDVYHATYKRYIRIDENAHNDSIIAHYNGQMVNIDLYRGMNPQTYTTIAFPFTLSMARACQLFGENTIVGEFTSMENENNQLTFRFWKLGAPDTLYAGHPYLMLVGHSVNYLTIDSIQMVNRLDTVKQEWADLTSIFSPYWMEHHDYSLLFLKQNRLCYPANPSGPYRGLRAYFKLKNGVDGRMRTVLAQEGVNMQVEYVDGLAEVDPAVDETMMMTVVYTPTALEWVTPDVSHKDIRKIIYKGVFYICYDGVLYNALGEKVVNFEL